MSENKPPKNKGPFNNAGTMWIYGIIIVLLMGLQLYYDNASNASRTIDYSEFKTMVEHHDVSKVVVINKQYADIYIKAEKKNSEKYKDLRKNNSIMGETPDFKLNVGSIEVFEEKVKDLNAAMDASDQIQINYEERYNWFRGVMAWVIPLMIFLVFWMFLLRRMGGGGGGAGGQIFNIGKSRATLFDNKAKVNVTFKDVAGLDEAKEEVMEVVDFLKNPKKYTALGGKIPKGVLLVGPPGTGKTLLAKATAGEAGVPFFSISGSDFVEMFVGVGASRVRDLFKQAREKAPCIIFIDEIDAIGRARGRNAIQGGNDERENTLNQLLVEMDGFTTDKGVILMAATNRPDILDSALLRPGRFDRQIGIDRPDIKGREDIFKVHLKDLVVASSVDASILAEMTPGFAGAEIANVCNEAALIASRRNKKAIDMDDFNYALDKAIGGLEKKNKLIPPKEKEIIAFHEAGHAICGWFLEHASPLVKVTIVPRGVGTLGYAQYLPKDEYITRTEALLDRMCMTFGGRAAEKIIFDKISTGAQNDLDQITKMAYSMVAMYGMNEEVGNVSFYSMQQDQFNKPYSDETAALIDSQVRKLVQSQYKRAMELLQDKREELIVLANQLLEKEVLTKSDVERLIGKRPFPEMSLHGDVVKEAEKKHEEEEEEKSSKIND